MEAVKSAYPLPGPAVTGTRIHVLSPALPGYFLAPFTMVHLCWRPREAAVGLLLKACRTAFVPGCARACLCTPTVSSRRRAIRRGPHDVRIVRREDGDGRRRGEHLFHEMVGAHPQDVRPWDRMVSIHPVGGRAEATRPRGVILLRVLRVHHRRNGRPVFRHPPTHERLHAVAPVSRWATPRVIRCRYLSRLPTYLSC